MRVLITGGTGLIGKATAERLLAKGWEVRIVDKHIPPEAVLGGAEYAECDILHYDDLLAQTRGCDAVIHMAAIRSPVLAPGPDVFEINVAGTFNVYEAAAASGIQRVAQASSINAIGSYYGIQEVKPPYFPIDEQIASYTTDPYSLSKQMIEEIGAYYWRRCGISSVAMRYPGVYPPAMVSHEGFLNKRVQFRELLAALAALPEAELKARMTDANQRAQVFRTEHYLEFRDGQPPASRGKFSDDPLFWSYVSDRFNFWAIIDVRDAAQSLEKGITADYEGAHHLYINDRVNALGADTQTMIRLFFPDTLELKGDLSGSASLVSIDKARKLIGYEPEHSLDSLTSSSL
ncbi:MAG: NAD-dependent epimerase/dehydratase family protein [Chloroflexi bacterium]|nr:NAD-dependent epimerase/dehydratase family protein [Chloroflexota bacterium]